MSNVTIPQEQWPKILDFLRDRPDCYVGQEDDCKRFIEAVLWITRSGGQWRLLPQQYGNWNSVYKRFARWCDRSIWERMLDHFADEPDMEFLIIDSTIVRAHTAPRERPIKRGPTISGARSESGRIQHEDPRERGQQWQSTKIRADCWGETRHHPGGGVDSWIRGQVCDSRYGVRLQRVHPAHWRKRDGCGDTSSLQSKESAFV